MDDKETLSTLKLYSPLHAQYFPPEEPDGSEDEFDTNEPLDLWGEDLTDWKEQIQQAIQSDRVLQETPRGLMEFYHGSQSVNEKVFSLHPTVEERDGVLYGVSVCQIKSTLTADELAELKSYCTGQYADGWGESFEQRPLRSKEGEVYVSFWQSADFFIKTEAETGYPKQQRGTTVKQVNIETFWTLLEEAKAVCGQDLDASAKWIQNQLEHMPPEQSLHFHAVFNHYLDAASQYGLWDAASVMCRGCSDDGFIDFRAWLIAQGKEVYLAALENPDSLAAVPVYGDCSFAKLCYVADKAFQSLTGESACYISTPKRCQAELRQATVRLGEGIQYPHTWAEMGSYLPRLCAKFIPPDEMKALADGGKSTWCMDHPAIQNARQAFSPQKKNRPQQGGNTR